MPEIYKIDGVDYYFGRIYDKESEALAHKDLMQTNGIQGVIKQSSDGRFIYFYNIGDANRKQKINPNFRSGKMRKNSDGTYDYEKGY